MTTSSPRARVRQNDAAPPIVPSLEGGLKQLFGFDQFRPGQRDVMEAILGGANALVVMPTGSGKSLCYQLPACALEGITLVISPLIALMKDQVDAMTERGIPATLINSSISTREQMDRLRAMEAGEYKIVYVAPERFRSGAFCEAIARTPIGLFAIDEAHCISQWGHDFRPDYLILDKIRAQLGNPPTVALTATATSQVQRDILQQLSLPDADVFVYGFERPNLFFEVHDTRSKASKTERVNALIDHYDGEPVLIYCATRKQVEEVSADLAQSQQQRHEIGMYHAGLSDGERARVQDSFMDGRYGVMVATNAFGMGVDKSNIRGVIHYNVPGSIEAYYQEAGRAGRDGDPSHCLLLFNYADRGIHEFFNEQTFPPPHIVTAIWDFVSRFGVGTHTLSADQIAQQVSARLPGRRLNSWAVESALRLLQRAGHMEFGVREGFPWLAVHEVVRGPELQVDWEYLERRSSVNADLLSDVVRYASGRDCRQLYLLRYFNSRPSFEGGCGHCDVCCGTPDYAVSQGLPPDRQVIIHEPINTVIQKTLAGLARTRGRFGAHIVAGMLRGSRSKKMQSFKLERLTTYGILRYMTQPDLVELLDVLLRYDLVMRDEHGCLGLTEAGSEVMRDPDQMSSLVRAHMEAWLIPHTARPAQTRAAPAPPASGAPAPPPGGGTSLRSSDSDTYAETLTMIQQGDSPAEIAQARGVTMQTVLRHLMVLADRGDRFDLTPHLEPRLLEAIREAAKDWSYGDALSPVKDASPACTYDELKLHLTQLLMERHA